MFTSVSKVSASDSERSVLEFRRLCKLQANDYQYVSDGSLNLIDSAKLTAAHKSRHSLPFNNNPKKDGLFFARIVLCSRQIGSFLGSFLDFELLVTHDM